MFATLLIVGSAIGAPPTGHFYPHVVSGTKIANETVSIAGTFYVNFTGGSVVSGSPSQYYKVFWFFGEANATGGIDIRDESVAPPAGCVLSSNCTTGTSYASMTYTFNRTGSFDVSVTIYDAGLDYTIYSFVVNVEGPPYQVHYTCTPTSTHYPENQVVEFWPQAMLAGSAVHGLEYVWNWGDGTMSYGRYSSGCYLGSADGFAQHRWAHPGTYSLEVTAINTTTGEAGRSFTFVNITNPGGYFIDVNVPTVATTGVPFPVFANVTDDNYPELANESVVWNFGDGPNYTMSLRNLTEPGCVYALCPPASIEFSHEYTISGTFNWEVWLIDDQEVLVNGTSLGTLTTITCSGSASGKTAPTAYGTIGTDLELNASALGNVALGGTTGINYTWDGVWGKEYGPSAEVGSYLPGRTTQDLWVNRSGGGNLITNTQTVSWSRPAPTVSLTAAYVYPFLNVSAPGPNWNSITATLIAPYAQFMQPVNPVTHSISTWNPLGPFYLGDQYLLQIVYVPNPSDPSSATSFFLNISFEHTTYQYRFLYVFPNPAGTQTVDWSLNPMMMQTPVSLVVESSSPAETALNTTVNYGDSSFGWSNVSKPAQFAPTFDVRTFVHTWAGSTYTLTLTTSDGSLSRSITYQVVDSGSLSINSTAPGLALSVPARQTAGVASTFVATVSTINGADTASSVVSWTFGDGATATGASVTHAYANAGVFPVYAYAVTPHGSTGIAWKRVTVVDPGPTAVMRITPTSPVVESQVKFDGTLSYESTLGGSSLGYLWNFGDGGGAAGFGNVSAIVYHSYRHPGTFTVYLNLTDGSGHTNSTSTRLTVHGFNISATIQPNFVTYTGLYTMFSPNVTVPSGNDPFLNGTWSWSDSGTNPFPAVWDTYHWGVDSGHTFMNPGLYEIDVNLSDPLASHPVELWTNVTVLDQSPLMVVPYQEGIIYGANHSSLLESYALGSYADLYHPTNLKWNFTWRWCGGCAQAIHLTKPPVSFVNHSYNSVNGPFSLSVSVITPWPTGFQGTNASSASLVANPDWDSDGLPNSFEMLVTHTNPGFPLTVGTPNDQGATGYGLTDYFASTLALGNLSADPDGDGLTTAQELTGSVTGFPSNPLDANTAGDGLPDGQHFFTDQFGASEAMPFPTSNPAGLHLDMPIPNVTYGGPYTGYNSTRLSVEFNVSSMSALAGASLSLIPPWGQSIPLSLPSSNVGTYFLLNNTPYGGMETAYTGMYFGMLGPKGTWTVDLFLPTGYTPAGGIASAELTDSYWMNPAVADPTFQGMLQGNGTTTAIYDCGASSTEYFPYFDFSTFRIINENYWPYTETYYKLSVMQGVPYVPGWSASIAATNNASGKCPTGIGALVGHTASYLGDGNFAISPWNAHAAGDAALTNGMKALGATNYTLTAGQFEEYDSVPTPGAMVPAPTSGSYPADPLETKSGGFVYTLPLNPTAFSTAGDGVADSVAADPEQALGLQVTVSSGADPTCYWPVDAPGTELMEMTSIGTGSGGNPITVFTNGVYGGVSGGSSCPYYPAQFTESFTWGETYFLPLNPAQSTWRVNFEQYYNWQAWNFGTTPTNLTYTDVSGSTSSSAVVNTPSGSSVSASVQVVPLDRTPAILVNSTGELANVPGYGPRYEGEQQFYAFNVNMGTSNVPAPFSPGMNIVLESRAAFQNSSVNATLVTNSGTIPTSDPLNCMDGLNGNPSPSVTVRDQSQPEPMALLTSWTVDLSASSTTMQCGVTLLNQLVPKNSTATLGSYEPLSTLQVNRLGLTQDALFLVPVLTCSACTGQTGSPPTTSGGIIQGWGKQLENDLNALPGELLWAFEHPDEWQAALASALAQWVWGTLSGIAAGMLSFVEGELVVFAWVYSAVINLMDSILSDLSTTMVNFWTTITAYVYNQQLCYEYQEGLISSTDFTTLDTYMSGGKAVSYTTCASEVTDLDVTLAALIIGGAVLSVGVLIVNTVMTIESFGTSEVVEEASLGLAKEAIDKDLSTSLKSVAEFLQVSLALTFLGAVESNSGVSGAVANDLHIGPNAAGDIVTAASFYENYELYNVATASESKLAGPIALMVGLDAGSFILGGMGDVIPTSTPAEAQAKLDFSILGMLVSAAALGYTVGLAYYAETAELFPLDAGELVASSFGIFLNYYDACQADNAIDPGMNPPPCTWP